MSISIETLALAKAYTDSHGGGGDPSTLGKLAKKDYATGKYTPDGAITVDLTKQKVTSIKSVGSLPELQLEVTGKNLKVSFEKGTLPEQDTEIDVLTAVATTWTGTEATIRVE